jgi:regulator of RNase E activity RraA
MQLGAKELEEIRQFDSPTVCNAIESFGVRPRTEGFMGARIRSIILHKKPYVGYAATAKISARRAPTDREKELLFRYYASVKDTPSPSIAVIEDVDTEPIGSFWGEVQATTHLSLGCMAVVTSGGVRDIAEVERLGFAYFARFVLVSHAYVHVEDCSCPVTVGGLSVEPGDLLFADQQGVVLMPQEIAPRLAEACRVIQRAEEPMLRKLRDRMADCKGVSIDELRAWRGEMVRMRDGKTS